MRIRYLPVALTAATLGLTIALAQSPPPGNWVKDPQNPVLVPGTSDRWDGGAVFAPSVLSTGEGFDMWYTGNLATMTAVAVPAIGHAASPDGTGWTKDASNPVLTSGPPGAWDAEGVEAPAVLRREGTYHLWYAGRNEVGTWQIGYATSPDGVIWTRHEANPVLEPGAEGSWDERGVRPGTVLWIDGEYRMWYTGVNVFGTASIGTAGSLDGVRWTENPGNPVLFPQGVGWESMGVYRPAVVFDGTTYRMWYTGVDASGVHRIGFATSSDGVHWARDRGNPVLEPGGLGAWDATGLEEPAVVWKAGGATYHLWYAGGASDTKSIGHATARGGYGVYLPLIARD